MQALPPLNHEYNVGYNNVPMAYDDRQISAYPLQFYDNRSARSTNSNASDFMNNLWYAEDGLEQHYGDKDDLEEASAILGKYERDSRFNKSAMGKSDNGGSNFDLFVANEEQIGREGVAEQIQRLKRSVSRNSLSRLGKRTYQIL